MSKWSSGLARIIRRDDVSLKASAAQTASTNGSTVELGDAAAMTLVLDVTAGSGTNETLDITVQGSDDGTNWHTLGTFTQATGVTTERKTMLAARYVRYASTIGGTDTPSFTYSLTGTAV